MFRPLPSILPLPPARAAPARVRIVPAGRAGARRPLKAAARFRRPAEAPAGGAVRGVPSPVADGRVSRGGAGGNRRGIRPRDHVAGRRTPPFRRAAGAVTRGCRQPRAPAVDRDAAKPGPAAFVEDACTGGVPRAVSLQGCLAAAR